MFGDLDSKVNSSDADEFNDALQSIEELEASISESVLRRRAATRYKLCASVVIHSGNLSERGDGIRGVTGDVSSGGCLIIGTRAILPGDLFCLDFGGGDLADLGSVFARCLRCRFITEGRFEIGVRFLETIDVEYALHDQLEDID